MRLPFQTFTQRDVPQFATPQPMQVATPAAPAMPRLEGNVQLQQTRAATDLIDSIVGAANSYKSMERAFEEDRLRAERKLEKKASEDALAAQREFEPQLADYRRQVRMGTLSAKDAISKAKTLFAERLGKGSRAYNKLVDNNAGFRGDVRSIETTRLIADREDNVAAFTTEQDRKYNLLLARQKGDLETNPDVFSIDKASAEQRNLASEFVEEYKTALDGFGYSKDQIEKMASVRADDFKNANNLSDLEYSQKLLKLEQADAWDQATVLFDVAFEREIANLKERPVSGTAFDREFISLSQRAAKKVLEDERLSGLTESQKKDFIRHVANTVNSRKSQFRAQNIEAYERNGQDVLKKRVSDIIDDVNLDGEYKGSRKPGSAGNEKPVEQVEAKNLIRVHYENKFNAGIFGDPELKSTQAAVADKLNTDLGRLDKASVAEWFTQEYPDVKLTVAELEKGGDGAYPHITGDERKQLIMEGRRLIKSLKAEEAAGNRPYQKGVKVVLDNYIRAVANREPVPPGDFPTLLESGNLSVFEKNKYFTELNYAKSFSDKISELGGEGGLEDMSLVELRRLKADIKPEVWRVDSSLPEEDWVYTKVLTDGLYPKFVKRIDSVINRRKSDPAGVAQDIMDRKGIGRQGDLFDPGRVDAGLGIQKELDPDGEFPRRNLSKKDATQIGDFYDLTKDGDVDQFQLGIYKLSGSGALVRAALFSQVVNTETEVTSNLIKGEGLMTKGSSLALEVSDAIGEPAAIVYLYAAANEYGDSRRTSRLHEAVNMDRTGFANRYNLTTKDYVEAARGDADVMKAMNISLGTGRTQGAKANDRVFDVIVNYAMTLSKDTSGLSPQDAIEQAATHIIEMQGDSFAQSSYLGDSGAYVPIPKDADARDWEVALSSIDYWVEAKRDSIKALVGKDQLVTRVGVMATGGNWSWVAVGDGTVYQLYSGAAGDIPLPVFVSQAEVSDYISGRRIKPPSQQQGQ